jgi:RNA polymerase sigma-70 factor (ECF subfamily)
MYATQRRLHARESVSFLENQYFDGGIGPVISPLDHKVSELDPLVARAVQGDTDALSRLLATYGPQVEQGLKLGRTWRAALDPGDVMQVTYLEAFMQIASFRPEQGEFLTWLRRIADNNLRDAIRGLKRHKQPPPSRRIQSPRGTDSFVGLYDLLAATSSTPSRQMARKDIQRLLEAAIDKLPADYATAIRLYDLECRPMDDVVKAMGRSTGAIHMLRARAHERLSELLGTASAWFNSCA